MVVGILRLTLSIPGARSLKDKRRVVHKIVERARSRYNASIAEVDDEGEGDLWQRSLLGVAVVSNDRRFVDEVLAKITRDVEANADASLLAREVELQSISAMNELPQDKPNLDPTDDELAQGSGWDLEEEERLLAGSGAVSASAGVGGGDASEAQDAAGAGVGGGDAGEVGAGAPGSGWLTESDFEGEAK